jgi:hypothetical protein
MGYASEQRMYRECIAAVLIFIHTSFAILKFFQHVRGRMQTHVFTLTPPAALS